MAKIKFNTKEIEALNEIESYTKLIEVAKKCNNTKTLTFAQTQKNLWVSRFFKLGQVNLNMKGDTQWHSKNLLAIQGWKCPLSLRKSKNNPQKYQGLLMESLFLQGKALMRGSERM